MTRPHTKQIRAAVLGSPTYTSLTDHLNTSHSAGWVSGGSFTDNLDGTIDVAVGSGFIRATDSIVVDTFMFDWPVASPLALTDSDTNYIYAEYNGGTPQVVATVTERTDLNTNVLLGRVYRTGTTLHINTEVRHQVSDHASRMALRMKQLEPFAHVSGGLIAETGTRNFSLTAGSWWEGLSQFSTVAFDSSTADTFDYYYRDGVGGFTEVTAQSQIDNTQWDDGDGGLATLSNNKFGVHWVYLEVDDEVSVLYGRADYANLSAAEDALQPSDVPEHIVAHGRLVGRIIIEKNAATFNIIENNYEARFASSGGATALQGAYDNSPTPEITTDATRGAVSFKRGSAADTDNVTEVQNGAGTVTHSVKGIGNVTMIEQAAPATPASGYVTVYPKTDGKLYIKDDLGTETDLTGGGGGHAITNQAGDPVSTPSTLGETNIDTTDDVMYGAVGTASATDWASMTNGPIVRELVGVVVDGDGEVTTTSGTLTIRSRMIAGINGTDYDAPAGYEEPTIDLYVQVRSSEAVNGAEYRVRNLTDASDIVASTTTTSTSTANVQVHEGLARSLFPGNDGIIAVQHAKNAGGTAYLYGYKIVVKYLPKNQ